MKKIILFLMFLLSINLVIGQLQIDVIPSNENPVVGDQFYLDVYLPEGTTLFDALLQFNKNDVYDFSEPVVNGNIFTTIQGYIIEGRYAIGGSAVTNLVVGNNNLLARIPVIATFPGVVEISLYTTGSEISLEGDRGIEYYEPLTINYLDLQITGDLPGCTIDDDCTELNFLKCNEGMCVECIDNNDCSGLTPVCSASVCMGETEECTCEGYAIGEGKCSISFPELNKKDYQKCNDNIVGDGCSFSMTQDCPEHSICDEVASDFTDKPCKCDEGYVADELTGTCVIDCDNPCTEGERTCVDADTYRNCIQDQNGCWVWSPAPPLGGTFCNPGLVCQEGSCVEPQPTCSSDSDCDTGTCQNNVCVLGCEDECVEEQIQCESDQTYSSCTNNDGCYEFPTDETTFGKCSQEAPYCSVDKCVECTKDPHCEDGEECTDNFCEATVTPTCNEDSDCAENEVCQDNECIESQPTCPEGLEYDACMEECFLPVCESDDSCEDGSCLYGFCVEMSIEGHECTEGDINDGKYACVDGRYTLLFTMLERSLGCQDTNILWKLSAVADIFRDYFSYPQYSNEGEYST